MTAFLARTIRQAGLLLLSPSRSNFGFVDLLCHGRACPVIHVFLSRICCKDVDARHKAGHERLRYCDRAENNCRAGSRRIRTR